MGTVNSINKLTNYGSGKVSGNVSTTRNIIEEYDLNASSKNTFMHASAPNIGNAPKKEIEVVAKDKNGMPIIRETTKFGPNNAASNVITKKITDASKKSSDKTNELSKKIIYTTRNKVKYPTKEEFEKMIGVDKKHPSITEIEKQQQSQSILDKMSYDTSQKKMDYPTKEEFEKMIGVDKKHPSITEIEKQQQSQSILDKMSYDTSQKKMDYPTKEELDKMLGLDKKQPNLTDFLK